jgi:hypothetical protein
VTCKPSTSSPVPAADCSVISSSDTRQSEQLSLIPTAAEYCESAPPTDGSPACACTKATFGCSIHPTTPAEWIACMQASLASLTASLASERAKLTSVICGPTPAESLASYDRDSCCWKTSQASFLTDTPPLSSENFPRWGMTVGGRLFPLPMLELHTGGNGGGALLNVPTPTSNDAEKRGNFNPVRSWGTAGYAKLWPTPVAQDDNKSPEAHMAMKARMKGGPRYKPTSLNVMVKGVELGMWPTPTSTLGTKGGRVTARKSREGGTLIEAVSARAFPTPSSNDWKGSARGGQRRGQLTDPDMQAIPAGGKLSPVWVEWLMGWPLGWTGLKRSATAKSASRKRSPGASSEGRE